MHMNIKLLAAGILAWGLALPASGAGDVPMVDSLKATAKEAAALKIPILVVFTHPGCHFCERVKSDYLGPMIDDPSWKGKVIIRQIEAGSDWDLIDFNGKKTTQGEFAASEKVRMVPTVMVFGPDGKVLADPIVGLLTPDFYYGYLQSAIEEGLDKISGKKK